MSRTLVPAAANLICQHGTHVLLIKRSNKTTVWPNFWAFPGGKVDENELFREAAIRETLEEIGLIIHPEDITGETVVMHRSMQGTKVVYFGRVENYENAPEILEPDLASDLAWFPIGSLPEPMIPHHKIGLDAIRAKVGYVEVDVSI